MLQNRVETVAPGTSTGFNEVQVNEATFENPVAETIIMPEPNFEQKKHLYSEKPLRVPRRHTIADIEKLEEELDLKDALDSLNEKGSISLDDFKKQLGI